MLVLVSWATPILFCGTDCFQYRQVEGRVWRLRTTLREPLQELQ